MNRCMMHGREFFPRASPRTSTVRLLRNELCLLSRGGIGTTGDRERTKKRKKTPKQRNGKDGIMEKVSLLFRSSFLCIFSEWRQPESKHSIIINYEAKRELTIGCSGLGRMVGAGVGGAIPICCISAFFRARWLRPLMRSWSLRCCGGWKYLQGGFSLLHRP